MKVLHLLKTSAGATWALRQTRELVKLGIEVHVMLPDGPLVKKYQDSGIHTHILQSAINIKKPWKNIRLFKTFRTIVNDISPDIIHSHFVATTLTMRLALGKNHPIKRIFHVPGPLHLEHTLYRKAEIFTSGVNDYWLASCKWTSDTYQANGINKNKIGLVYYGVDLHDFKQGLTANLHDELGIDKDIKLIGNIAYFYSPKRYLGQKRGLKGHEDLIDAIDIIAQEDKSVAGVFVGGAWGGNDSYMNKVKEYANNKKFGKVYFLGHRNDVQKLYGDFSVSVHPSHSENVGGAVESLLCQSPTICTNIGGFPDLVKDNKTGWLSPVKNPEQLAKTILSALKQPELRVKYAKQGNDLAKELFDIRNNAKDINAYYKKLLTSGVLGEVSA